MIVLGTNKNAFYEENPKGNVTCNSYENWDVLNHGTHIVENVCKSKNYNVDREPNEDNLTHLDIMFTNIKVVDVDEKKKRITVDITAMALWEDTRIRTIQSKDNRAVRLPSITKGGGSPVIWNPFFTARISPLAKVRYVFDPTMIQMSFVHRQLATNLFETHITSANTLLLASRIDWSLTISCGFDFSTFPFDKNDCLLQMTFLNSNVTLHNNKPNSATQINQKYSSEGFEIFTEASKPKLEVEPILGVDMYYIRFNISMKRQVGKYVYQYYVPCITIVMAASFSFIIPLSAIPGRVALMVTQFLTLTNIFINQMVRI